MPSKKLLVPRGETYALECAIRHYKNTDKMMRKIGLLGDSEADKKITAISDTILADLRALRRRVTDGRPRQTYK